MQKEVGVRKPGLLERIFSRIAWQVIVGLVYIGGLSMLIPAAYLYVFPQELNIVSPVTSPAVLWTAVGMVVVGFFVTLWHTKGLGLAFKSLGRITFIPGLIGLIMSVFGRDLVLLYLAGTIPKFETIRTILTSYLDNAVPRVRYLTMSFFVLGIVLWLIGDKLVRDKVMTQKLSLIRKH
jgi:hypothetical protein